MTGEGSCSALAVPWWLREWVYLDWLDNFTYFKRLYKSA